MAFSPDGKTVLTGSHDTTTRLWETASGKPLGPPLQHQVAVHAVAFSPHGKTLLIGSQDKAARRWQVAQPPGDDPARLLLWTQVITGLELDELGAIHVLDAAMWEQRRQRLHALGGPPES